MHIRCVFTPRTKRVFALVDHKPPVFGLNRMASRVVECNLHTVIIQNDFLNQQLHELFAGLLQDVEKESKYFSAGCKATVFMLLIFDFH